MSQPTTDFRRKEEIAAAFAQIAEGGRIMAQRYAEAFERLGAAVRNIKICARCLHADHAGRVCHCHCRHPWPQLADGAVPVSVVEETNPR